MPKRKEAGRSPADAGQAKRSDRKKSAVEAGSKVRAFHIAGIGASAGGLEVLKDFFRKVPEQSGIAYVIITHLAPGHKSILVQLLQKQTKMQVFEAADKMRVKRDCVYVLPPGKEMSIIQGSLQLMNLPINKAPHPIDFFFRSLAQDQGENAIGIILSGTGTDGSQGIRDIKSEGGLVIVQESTEAAYTGMPLSAIDTGMTDYVLPAREMPETLIDYVRHSIDIRLRRIKANEKEAAPALKKIFVLIRNEVGLDFSLYKPDHLIRGIRKQMSMNRIGTMDDYVRFLRANPDEVGRLARALLVKVTRFFRDEFAFDILKQKGLPLITQGKDKKTPVRIWVPGCSTGEEAYSIAIMMREYMDEIQARFAVQIFATDVDSRLIEHARQGIYPAGIEEDVSPERLARFFDKTGPEYKIRDDIRSMVIFAVQDLVKGPTFMRLDMISCRNLLIYMNTLLQKKIIPLFHMCLNAKGILLLGTSETIGSFGDLFSALDNRARLFQAREVKSPPLAKSMRALQMPEVPSFDNRGRSFENESVGALLDRTLGSNPAGDVIAQTIREALARLEPVEPEEPQAKGKKVKGKKIVKPSSSRELALQGELKELRERLQTVIEELETSNEELRSSNEELESVNEELLTLNAEFQNKIDELADARINMDMILSGAQIATVFLGNNLAIRSFTPSVEGIVNLLTSDIGRNLRDFSFHLNYPDVVGDIERVIRDGSPKEAVIQHENGTWYLVRILPHRKKGRLDGVAITFIDVSEQKEAERKYKAALSYANGIIETVREPLIVLDADLCIVTANRSFYNTFKVGRSETEKKYIYDLGDRQWDIPGLRTLLEEVLPRNSQFENFPVEYDFGGTVRKMLLNARQIKQEGLGVQMILLAIEEVTGDSRLEEES